MNLKELCLATCNDDAPEAEQESAEWLRIAAAAIRDDKTFTEFTKAFKGEGRLREKASAAYRQAKADMPAPPEQTADRDAHKQACAWIAQEIESVANGAIAYPTKAERLAYRQGLLIACEVARKYMRGEGQFQKLRCNQQ